MRWCAAAICGTVLGAYCAVVYPFVMAKNVAKDVRDSLGITNHTSNKERWGVIGDLFMMFTLLLPITIGKSFMVGFNAGYKGVMGAVGPK